jgi:RNA recognition motif-containing protein
MWVRNNKGNVFVGNLPLDFSDERLAETFDPFGIVLTAAIARDPATGARLRYGFVDIATERAATKAIAALDGSEVDGCKLNVKARERPVKKPGGAPPRRAPFRAAMPERRPREADETPVHRLPQLPTEAAEWSSPSQSAQSQSTRSHPAQSQSARSQEAREGLPEVEPPPRRDFEVVRRPIRRTPPTFQVERRSLPRRV